jgi:ribosome-associated protein
MDENQYIQTGVLDKELKFAFSRSSGPGGQHVNKVNTKVELRFNIDLSQILEDEQKEILRDKLSTQISQDGDLIIISQATRSQLKNKDVAIDKFYLLINQALKPKKKRKPTKVSKGAIEKRLKEKKELAEKKSRRKLNI